MSATAKPPSIHTLLPEEFGGVEARQGFAFQDHVAAGFCLDMALATHIAEVWCEDHDDIVLVIRVDNVEFVEFVQVKASEIDQLWTVAKLCEKEQGADGPKRCILEKSLGHDRCCEPCRFRIVTARPAGDQLKILALPLDAPGRIEATEEFVALHGLLKPRVGDYRSPNGNDYTFWSARVVWDARHTEAAVQNENLLKLFRLLESQGQALAPDQRDELYRRLLHKVWTASKADPQIALEPKRIKRADLLAWLATTATQLGLPTAGVAEKLTEKMKKASLPEDVFALAVDQLRYYRQEQLRPKYMPRDEQREVESEVAAILQGLKSELDRGKLPDDGVEFHGVCLDTLEKLRPGMLPSKTPPRRAFVQGCMYSIAGRCLHRFRRIGP